MTTPAEREAAALLGYISAADVETVRAEGAGDAVAGVLPCPFCGGHGITQRLTDGYKWGAASCLHCSASAPEVRTRYGPLDTWMADALDEWNTRATPPRTADAYAQGRADTLAAVRAAVEGMVDDYQDCMALDVILAAIDIIAATRRPA